MLLRAVALVVNREGRSLRRAGAVNANVAGQFCPPLSPKEELALRRRGTGSKVIVTRTPLRISFAGGGTDLPEFYEVEEGAVLSAAVDKYVYVTVKRHSELFNEPIRLNYSRTEQVNSIDEIENNIARECLKFLEIEPPIFISTVADMPASTGMGGSSAFAVGLLNALHAFRGERVTAGQLAEEACYIEMEVLKEPIGKQDQYAAAFGGLNLFGSATRDASWSSRSKW